MSRSWCLERSITIYMLIFDSSLLPDAHALVQRYKTLVLWVLSRTERHLRMEELTSRSDSQMFIQLLRHFFFLKQLQYMTFTLTVLETFLLVRFLILLLILNCENPSKIIVQKIFWINMVTYRVKTPFQYEVEYLLCGIKEENSIEEEWMNGSYKLWPWQMMFLKICFFKTIFFVKSDKSTC